MNQCPKCESMRSSHYGSTKFYSVKWCFDCGNKWRVDYEPPYVDMASLVPSNPSDHEIREWEEKKKTLRPYELPSITT